MSTVSLDDKTVAEVGVIMCAYQSWLPWAAECMELRRILGENNTRVRMAQQMLAGWRAVAKDAARWNHDPNCTAYKIEAGLWRTWNQDVQSPAGYASWPTPDDLCSLAYCGYLVVRALAGMHTSQDSRSAWDCAGPSSDDDEAVSWDYDAAKCYTQQLFGSP
jgi:hypothetical protein